MNNIKPIEGEDPLEMLKRCGGYYSCPKDEQGKRRGPLVGYAGLYGDNKQYVGDVYANFAKAERHGEILKYVAEQLLPRISRATGFCGAPEGGKALATMLAVVSGAQYIFPDKEVTALKTATAREKSKLVFARHEPAPGETWWITEDVCNNFSTTASLIELIEQHSAEVAGIVCFLNRSLTHQTIFPYRSTPYKYLPIVALTYTPISEWTQDDAAVAEDVNAGNVVWKPKNEWDKLPQ